MNDKKTTINELKRRVKKFVRERDWEQFHSPKSLSMSIAIEAAELMEKFQWLDNRQSIRSINDKDISKEVEKELADITIYIMDFCNAASIDLASAIQNKLNENTLKYPAEKVKGKAHKYTYYK